MSLEDTLLKLVEAVNRQAAATEKQNELITPKLVPLVGSFDPAIPGTDVTVVSEPEPRKPRTPKPKTEPTPEPKTEPTPEPEAETPTEPEPVQEIPSTGPIPVTMTPEQYRHAIRVRVREVMGADLVKKARWKKFMADWKMKDIQSVEVGDLPDILAQVSELDFLQQD